MKEDTGWLGRNIATKRINEFTIYFNYLTAYSYDVVDYKSQNDHYH